MIKDTDEEICPLCGGYLKYYDSVSRIVFGRYGHKNHIRIKRYRCTKCNSIHRAIPDSIFPYKRYEADIIIGVLEKIITCETIGFEDYPCEKTISRWNTQKIHILL